jgi:hypothetical protein
MTPPRNGQDNVERGSLIAISPARAGQRQRDRLRRRAARLAASQKVVPARCYPRHGGTVLAVQARWPLSALIAALERTLSETQAGDWIGQVRGLSLWRAVEE